MTISNSLSTCVDRALVEDLAFFWRHSLAAKYTRLGTPVDYTAPNPALAVDVDYFAPLFTTSGNTRYIVSNLAGRTDVSAVNATLNAIFLYLHNAPSVHRTLLGSPSDRDAVIDFEALSREVEVARRTRSVTGERVARVGDYTVALRERGMRAKNEGRRFWGTTEIHSSLQTASHRFVDSTYGEGHRSPAATAEWVSSWILDGTVDRFLQASSARAAFEVLTSVRGVGDHYGYVCTLDASILQLHSWDHDDRFSVAGPGALTTLKTLFPGSSVPSNDQILWLRDNQDTLWSDLSSAFHPDWKNLPVGGKPWFRQAQDRLMTNSVETGLCQYGVYRRYRENPSLISRRRVDVDDSDDILGMFGA